MRFLLERGVNIDLPDLAGRTARDHAMEMECGDAVALLDSRKPPPRSNINASNHTTARASVLAMRCEAMAILDDWNTWRSKNYEQLTPFKQLSL